MFTKRRTMLGEDLIAPRFAHPPTRIATVFGMMAATRPAANARRMVPGFVGITAEQQFEPAAEHTPPENLYGISDVSGHPSTPSAQSAISKKAYLCTCTAMRTATAFAFSIFVGHAASFVTPPRPLLRTLTPPTATSPPFPPSPTSLVVTKAQPAVATR